MKTEKRTITIPISEDVYKDAYEGMVFIKLFSNLVRSGILTDSELVTYMILLDFKGDKDIAYPSQQEIGRIRRKSRRTINDHISRLRDIGLFNIYFTEKFDSAIYLFNDIKFVTTTEVNLSRDTQKTSQGDEKNISQGVGRKLLTKKKQLRKNITNKLTLGYEKLKEEDLLNLGFSMEAVVIAGELKDTANILFYQKLINARDRGKIPDNKIQNALWRAKDYNNVLEKDGLPLLRKPASMFTKYLKESLGVKKLF